MDYELANIRQYTNNKGQPYFQVRLKKDSKLTDITKKVKPIALVDVDVIKEIANSSNIEKYKELQANYNNTSEELTELKQQLQEYKATAERLTAENEKLVEETLESSIEYHQISDVEVGSYLSGGVDSSYVVSVAKPNKTFTVGFEGKGFSEPEPGNRDFH